MIAGMLPTPEPTGRKAIEARRRHDARWRRINRRRRAAERGRDEGVIAVLLRLLVCLDVAERVPGDHPFEVPPGSPGALWWSQDGTAFSDLSRDGHAARAMALWDNPSRYLLRTRFQRFGWRVSVSTVFLVVTGDPVPPPSLWETAVFASRERLMRPGDGMGEFYDIAARYRSREAAIRGHARFCQLLAGWREATRDRYRSPARPARVDSTPQLAALHTAYRRRRR